MDGSIIWQRNVGPPVPGDHLNCSLFDLMGILGTPIVDLASRALFLDAMTTPDGGTTKKHFILSLNADTGDINSGWPVDVEAMAKYNGMTFTAAIQQQRPALSIVGNILYVGYGGLSDCLVYRGWLVGVPIDNPASVTAWASDSLPTGSDLLVWCSCSARNSLTVSPHRLKPAVAAKTTTSFAVVEDTSDSLTSKVFFDTSLDYNLGKIGSNL